MIYRCFTHLDRPRKPAAFARRSDKNPHVRMLQFSQTLRHWCAEYQQILRHFDLTSIGG